MIQVYGAIDALKSREEAQVPGFSPQRGLAKMLGTCTARGEIDMATAPALQIELFDCIERADEPLVNVDCAGVTFMDSAGYHVLVSATEFAVQRGHTLVIRNLPPACGRVIQMCNLDRELNLEPAMRRAAGIGAGTR